MSLGVPQVLLESKDEVTEAYKFVASLRDAFPEVLKGVKTAQLAQELLIYKEDYLSEIGKTGEASHQATHYLCKKFMQCLASLYFNVLKVTFFGQRVPNPFPMQRTELYILKD